MHPMVMRNYKTITFAGLAMSLMLASLLFLSFSDAVIITLYIVGMAAFILALGANAVFDIITCRQRRERFRRDPIHAVWAKNAWAKARDQGSAE